MAELPNGKLDSAVGEASSRPSLFSTLKSRSGVSIMFVLGIMFLLLAIGTSALAAATATLGGNLRQNEYNRAMTLSNSIHRSILYSLDPKSASAEQEAKDTLGGQIAFMIIEAFEEAKDDPSVMGDKIEIPLEIEITPKDEDGFDIEPWDLDDETGSVTLAITFWNVTEGGPRDYDAVGGTPRIPYTASINARMTVTVIIHTGGRLFSDDRQITTTATYQYSGAVMSDAEAAEGECNCNDDGCSCGCVNGATCDCSEWKYDLSFHKNEDGEFYYGTWTLMDYSIGDVIESERVED